MKIGRLDVFHFCDAMTAPEAAGFARRIQELGYRTLWFPEDSAARRSPRRDVTAVR